MRCLAYLAPEMAFCIWGFSWESFGLLCSLPQFRLDLFWVLGNGGRMVRALSAGSEVGLLQLEAAGQKALSLGCCGGRALCSPKASAEVCTSGKREALWTRAAVFCSACWQGRECSACPRCLQQAVRSSRDKWHGIMCEWLSPQHGLCLQQLQAAAGGQLSCADSLREISSLPSFLNVSLSVLSWHHFPIWELGGLPACCCPYSEMSAAGWWSWIPRVPAVCAFHWNSPHVPAQSWITASILEKEQDQAGCWSFTAFKPQCTK